MTIKNESLAAASLVSASVPFAAKGKTGVIVAIQRRYRLRQVQPEDVAQQPDFVPAQITIHQLAPPATLTIAEACAKFNLTERKMRSLLKQGRVKATESDKPTRVYEDSIRDYLAREKNKETRG
jgi:hypothetical protein